MTVAAIGITLGLLAMVIDVSWMYFHRNKLQNSITAAWKAGFDEMVGILRFSPTGFDDNAREKVRKRISIVFMENGFTANEASALSINFSGVGPFPEKLEIGISKKLDLFFATGIDFPFVTVSAFYNGGIPALNASSGEFLGNLREGFIFPVGVPHGEVRQIPRNKVSVIPFERAQGQPKDPNKMKTDGQGFTAGKVYLIRPGQDTAYQGANQCSLHLNFDPHSDYSYRSAIIFGYPKPLTINDRVSLIGSDVSSIVDAALQTRLSQTSPVRKAIVPLIDIPPENLSTPGKKPNQVYYLDPEKEKARVIGFALFELENPEKPDFPSKIPGQIHGKFVRYVVNPNEISRFW